MSKKSLYLVDISSYVFRAYYAIRNLKTSKGIPTNATYGVISMLLKLIREKKPDYLIIVFDSPTPSFRKEIYTQYKANREAPPEDLPHQFEHIKQFVEAYPLPSLQMAGFEADDLVATVVAQYRSGELKKNFKDGATDLELVIVSGDKDLMQLVGEDVVMYDSMKDKIITPAGVVERFGVEPSQVADVLSLAGDASDNIPGVEGIGEKTAAKLIAQWGSLEEVLKHADQIPGKLGERLKSSHEEALLSKKLVTLHSGLPLHPDWDCFQLGEPHAEKLGPLYEEWELWTLAKGLGGAEPALHHSGQGAALIEQKKRKYDLILTEENLDEWVQKLKSSNGFAFDTETTGLNPRQDHLVGISLATGDGKAAYIPVGHSYLGCPDQLPLALIQRKLGPLLTDPALPKFGQNSKFDCEMLHENGIDVVGVKGDTLIASYLCNPEGAHNLDHLAHEYLNHVTLKFEEVVGKGRTFEQVEVEKATAYSGEDADVTARLVPLLHAKLHEHQLWECYEKIEIPLSEVLVRMENRGVLVNEGFLRALSKEFGERQKNLEKQIYEAAGVEFNVQSPKQLGSILFDKLQLPVQRKTKTGYSTDVDVLEALSKLHPLPAFLLSYRTLAKLKSTYTDGLLELINPKTGRVHSHFNQTVAATGRLSSSDPNLQNIPIRTEEGRRIREAFVVPEGHVMLSADYSQIELRLLAAFSKEPVLVKAFEKNEDIHRLTAARIFNAVLEEVTPQQRSAAKTVNFGVLYGQSAFGLAQQLDIPQAEAKKYIEQFFAQYPRVKEYREEVLSRACEIGEVRTWGGRRRLTLDLASQNGMVRSNAERMAFNTIFQGSAADLIKVAMIQIDRKLEDQGFKSRMLLQVHDELIFEVPEGELEKMKNLVKIEMENAMPCPVPLTVQMGIGKNWAECK